MNAVKILIMFLGLLLIAAFVPDVSTAPAPPIIRHIEVEGNSRIPAASILRQVSLIPNEPFDPSKSQADLKKLYSLGLFEYLQVQSREAGQGQVDIVYQVREYPFISSFSIEGVEEGLESRIRNYLQKEKLELHPATPFSPSAGNKAAKAIRSFLRSQKYPNAEVQVLAKRQKNSVGVSLYIRPGQRLEVGAVRFVGNDSVPQSELLRQMQYARPAPFWKRWGGGACYVPEELLSDLQQIRLYYRSHGFAAVSIGEPHIQVVGNKSGHQQLEIEIPIVEGARYRLASLGIEGDGKAGNADVQRLVSAVQTPREYNYSLLESVRQQIVDALGHHGYALARVQLEQSTNEADRTIRAVYQIDPGAPAVIGMIKFRGNYHLPDKFLRRELWACEGEIFDVAKLDQSVGRLNKSNLLQKVRRSDVTLKMNEKTNLLDITFNVKEKEHQGIYATGGSGGISGGYLGVLYAAFNFLHLGETLSLELDGGAAQSNMLLNMIGTRFFGSPFTLALSVFNKYSSINVANMVTGPETLVGVLRKRSTGAGLSGAYPITASLQAGLGFEAGRDSIINEQAVNALPGRSLRSELAPFVLFDRTHGAGPETRGYRMSYSQALDGAPLLKSLDSIRESFQLTHYMGDPWTHGRNSFALNLRGAWVRPHGDSPLFLDRRFYPDDDSVRGFKGKSLSPWAIVSGSTNSAPEVAGADTVLGISTEYRVPIRGALSSAGFFDLGWTHLDPKNAAQLGTGARLIEQTNGVLRASLGGELRFQLPMIHQPARLIYSWNPLRLNIVIGNPSSVLRLAEPRTSLRFALGALY